MRSRRLPGLPVLTLDSGVTIGRIARSVVDPTNKRVAALLVSLSRWWGKRLLPIESVHAFGGHAVTVGSAEALIPIKENEDFAALLYEKRIPLLGSPVVTAGGELVGTVRDYEIDSSGAISTLYVTEGVWRALSGQEHEVPGNALMALGKDAVIVTEETLARLVDKRQDREGDQEESKLRQHGESEAGPPPEGSSFLKIASQRVRARLAPSESEPAPQTPDHQRDRPPDT